ncbi:hypothetical protein [Streptomyces sp. KL116D]|uniref:hypothetical protein n=1 Tax=Streptomyces sp. KL116D TaxID=3045152 RepID=UPI0035574732
MQLGPGRSGLSFAIDRMPEKEQKIVFVRMREFEREHRRDPRRPEGHRRRGGGALMRTSTTIEGVSAATGARRSTS